MRHVSMQMRGLLTGGPVPQVHRLIVPGGCEGVSIGAPSHRKNLRSVPSIAENFLPCGNQPDFDGTVSRSAGEISAVRAPGDGVDRVRVVLDDPRNCSRCHVPDANRFIESPRCQSASVRTPGDGPDHSGMGFDHRRIFLQTNVPKTN